MASPIPIDLKDAKPRSLFFGASAIRKFERGVLEGGSFFAAIRDHLDIQPPAYFVSGLLWAGLLREQPMLTLEAAEAMLDDYVERTGERYESLWPQITEALFECGIFGKSKEGASPNRQTEKAAGPSPSPGGSTT